MRMCDVHKLMFFQMDASFKTSVKARKLSGSTVIFYVKYIVNKKDGFIVVLLNLK